VKCRTFAMAAIALWSICVAVHAQPVGYPSKPIRVLVPFLTGGTPDIQIRMFAEKLTPRMGQQFVIDNRAGASGNIALEIAARAPADGYTLIIGTVGNWTVNPHLFKVPYDVLKDFAPIIHVGTAPAVLIVHPSLPVTNVKELIALAARRPGELNYGSSGIGGFGHICAELFSLMTKAKLTHVPYKGVAIALTELVGGHIQLMFNSAVPTLPHVKAGRVRALATTGAARVAAMADIPTVAEAGVPGYENSTWSMIAAPARTPTAVVDRLNAEFNAVLHMPDIRERLVAAGATVTGGTAKQAQDILRSEFAKFDKLVVQAGIAPADAAPR
jgi:tripartite-type tricarboxylate transporter receptor subunit TctC